MPPLKILLVEDNPDDEALALRALKKSEIVSSVDVVRDGQEALDYMFHKGAYQSLNQTDTPCVVLLDIQLPKMNGIDVLRNIRNNEKTALIPVVLLTSSDEERDMLDGYKAGANSYINKPVDFNAFVEQIKMLGNYWLGVNKTPHIHHA
ncbi:MAG: response regulator [Hahellaceae bacterium]|nr:response regulator [Hahellaceae bacterium]MCP5211541.1 response regulator [Hahellaceae bacterium]